MAGDEYRLILNLIKLGLSILNMISFIASYYVGLKRLKNMSIHGIISKHVAWGCT
jgi:hypothetical protein